ncbi:MAG: hypothetical protein V1790_06525, partial [Planctomycetota bacterium]
MVNHPQAGLLLMAGMTVVVCNPTGSYWYGTDTAMGATQSADATVSVALPEFVTVAVVPVAGPSLSDQMANLPAPLLQATVGDTFFAEVWAHTEFVGGLSMVSADIAFDAARLDAVVVIHTSLMNIFQRGSIDNVLGTINDLSGSHPPVAPACSHQVGVNGWARVAVLEMQAQLIGVANIAASDSQSPVYIVSLCGLLDAPIVTFDSASIDVVASAPPPGNPVWNTDPLSGDRTTRSLKFRVTAPV